MAVHEKMQYLIVTSGDGDDMLIILEDRLEPLREVLGTLDIVARLSGG